MCRVLAVSPSGYYQWRNRAPSQRAQRDRRLLTRIQAIHAWSGRTYGAPRIHAELQDEGCRVGCKRVARLMAANGLVGETRRRFVVTTQQGRQRPYPDRVKRAFQADRPNQLWVADITYIPTWAGFLYLASILDVFSRRIVGWAMATHMRTELVEDALAMALWNRQPAGVIHHSDQGCQYTSIAFGDRCQDAGITLSMGTVGDCFDNAMAESFFATLECELLWNRRFRDPNEAQLAVFQFIEGWYNPHRRHSALGNMSPIRFEENHANQALDRKPETVH